MESKHYHSIAGPFKIVIGRVEKCPDDDPTQQQLNMTLQEYRRRNAPTLYRGIAIMPFTLNDALSVRLSLASWDRVAGWKQNAHKFHVDHLCRSFTIFIPNLYTSFMRGIYGELPECNFLPGIYHYVNFTITWDDVPVKHFFYGRWRADMEITHPDSKRAACVRGYAETLPK